MSLISPHSQWGLSVMFWGIDFVVEKNNLVEDEYNVYLA